jgi:hypothetical protein
MSKAFGVSMAVLGALLLAPAAAAAQTAAPAEPAPAPPPPAVVIPAPPPPAPVVVPAPAPVADDPLDHIRVRAGANGAFAMFIPGISYGANFSGRGGVAFNRFFATYLDFGTGFGLGGTASFTGGNVGLSINVVSYWRLSLVGELNLGPFFVALGPSLFDGAWMAVGENVGSSGVYQAAYVAGGKTCPALLGRIGFSFGHRNRFTLALEGQVVWGKMTQVSQNVSSSGDVNQHVRIGAEAVGFAPALTLGWDMK